MWPQLRQASATLRLRKHVPTGDYDGIRLSTQSCQFGCSQSKRKDWEVETRGIDEYRYGMHVELRHLPVSNFRLKTLQGQKTLQGRNFGTSRSLTSRL